VPSITDENAYAPSMSGEHPPLTCKDLKKILAYLGFAFDTQEGSHEHWTKIEKGRKYKVTVDCPKAPFSQTLIKSMAEQAGKNK
jgi:predicted RNA binding protein YcfA (HicA-like mRNA interferase family)